MSPLAILAILLSFFFYENCNSSYQESNSILIGIPSEPASLDPRYATDLTSSKILRYLYATLVQQDPTGKPIPYLAEKFFYNPKSHSIGFLLPDFLSSTQVKDSLNILLQTPNPRREHYRGILEVKVLSPKELELRLHPSARYDNVLSLLSLPPASIEGNTGPYTLKTWKKGEFLLLQKNPYPNPNQKFLSELPEELKMVIVPNSTSGLFLYLKGRLDSFKLSDFLLSREIISGKPILEKKGKSVQYVAINNKNPCFDKNFRLALNYAIDRKKIIQKILENKAELTIGPIPRSRLENEISNLKWKMNSFQTLEYNPSLAKEYLSKSKCYPQILNTPIDFRMRADDENRSKGRAVAEYIRSLGLKIKIRPMEKALLYKENGQGKGDFTFLTWYADDNSLSAFLDPLFHSKKMGNGGNRAFYENERVDQHIQNKDVFPALQILIEDVPWIYLWSVYENYLLSERILSYPKLKDFL